VIAHAILPAGLEILLQAVEGGEPVRFLDDDLAVEQRRADAQLFQPRRDRAEALRPVEALGASSA